MHKHWSLMNANYMANKHQNIVLSVRIYYYRLTIQYVSFLFFVFFFWVGLCLLDFLNCAYLIDIKHTQILGFCVMQFASIYFLFRCCSPTHENPLVALWGK